MRCPEFADDLCRGDPLAIGDLLATRANRGLETSPILGIELVAIVVLFDKLEANLGAFREIDDILDHNATALDATVQQRHASEDTTAAGGKHGRQRWRLCHAARERQRLLPPFPLHLTERFSPFRRTLRDPIGWHDHPLIGAR